MNELLDKLDNLKKELDKNKNIIRIRQLNEFIYQDKELFTLIKKYQETKNIQLKEKIFENTTFREYKQLENEVNLIILTIRQELKKISDRGSCGR